MEGELIEKKSAIERLKELDEERKLVKEQAKQERLDLKYKAAEEKNKKEIKLKADGCALKEIQKLIFSYNKMNQKDKLKSPIFSDIADASDM